jgi:hypothetical protein
LKLKQRFLKLQEMALCLSRKWWRPFMLWSIAIGGLVNLVIIPWKTGKPIEFDKAAAWVGACGILSWVRAQEKAKGSAEK